MARIPNLILFPGQVVYELRECPGLGDHVVVYSRGRFRLAAVSKVTPTRLHTEYTTDSGNITRPIVKRGDVIAAPAPDPLAIALGAGGEPDPVYQRAWTIIGAKGNGAHSLAPVDSPGERIGYAGMTR